MKTKVFTLLIVLIASANVQLSSAATWMTLAEIDAALGHTSSSSDTELGVYGTDVLKDGAASYTFTKMRVSFSTSGITGDNFPVGRCEVRYGDTNGAAVTFSIAKTGICKINGKNRGYFYEHGTVITASSELYEFDLNKVCSTSGKTFYIKRYGHGFSTSRVKLYVTIKYTLTVKPNNTSYGTVSGSGSYPEGTAVTIKATPKTGCRFVKWNDGNTNASRSVTVNSNVTYTATFEPIQYTLYFNANGGLIPTTGKMGNTPSGYTTTLSDDQTTGTIVVTYSKSYFMTIIDDCPTQDGYIFDGWYSDPLNGEKVYDATGCCVTGNYWTASNNWCYTADAHLYAHWREKQSEVPIGAIKGLFSVSDSTKIFFAQGNLQYNAKPGGRETTHECADGTNQPGSWRFAENQYDYLGTQNSNAASTYTDWIDMFGWGTSGWNGSGATAHQPYATSTDTAEYYKGILRDSHRFADWGIYNAITNGGNQPALWRCPTLDELDYLLHQRSNAATLFGKGKIDAVNGLILLPDNWQTPSMLTFNPSVISFTDNIFTIEEWQQMEDAGAIFLPAAGYYRRGQSWQNGNSMGWYMTSDTLSVGSTQSPALLSIKDSAVFLHEIHGYQNGRSVRLVQQAQLYTITWLNYNDSILAINKEILSGTIPSYNGETPTKPADAEYTYSFAGWEPDVTEVTGDATYTAKFYSAKNIYEITWLHADGTELTKDSLEYGMLPEFTGDIPTKEETEAYTYTFTGWTPEVVTVTGDAIYTAVFDSTKVAYHVDVTIPDTIETHGTVAIEGEPTYGDTITLTANPEDGYYFDSWSDGNTDNPREIVVTEDINVYPIFKKCEEVIFTFSEVITKGESFEFAGMSLSQKGTYSDTTVLANGCDSITILKLNVVKPKTYNLRVVVNDETMGTVEGAGTYTQGQQVTITATPVSSKYVFVRWYNEDEDINIYDNPYTFKLNRNLQIRAVFRRGKK